MTVSFTVEIWVFTQVTSMYPALHKAIHKCVLNLINVSLDIFYTYYLSFIYSFWNYIFYHKIWKETWCFVMCVYILWNLKTIMLISYYFLIIWCPEVFFLNSHICLSSFCVWFNIIYIIKSPFLCKYNINIPYYFLNYLYLLFIIKIIQSIWIIFDATHELKI